MRKKQNYVTGQREQRGKLIMMPRAGKNHIKLRINHNSAFANNTPSPFETNSALFEQFRHDLENNMLPEIPNPTKFEIIYYAFQRHYALKKCLTEKDSLSNVLDQDLLRENNAIPIEVEIWVNKVYDYYFSSMLPMFGMIHFSEGARKQLYKYKGYNWHTISELHPGVRFD